MFQCRCGTIQGATAIFHYFPGYAVLVEKAGHFLEKAG